MNSPAAMISPKSGQTRSVVLFLHGYGSNAEDLISLAPYFADHLPDTLFLSPNAPEPCELGPYGWQWFSLLDRSAPALDAAVARTGPVLVKMLEQIVAETRVPLGKIALVGFSQGTMMALDVAARLPEAVAAVVGFSGKLLRAEALPETTQRPPVLLVHGTADEVVPYAALPHAEAALTAAGFKVETETCPGLGHGIDENGLRHAQKFLAEYLK